MCGGRIKSCDWGPVLVMLALGSATSALCLSRLMVVKELLRGRRRRADDDGQRTGVGQASD